MNLHEEDSSGSEAGSEVSFGSVAAETDRFGFILVDGSTAGSVGPPPEVVRQREVKWINIISQWDRILLKNKSKVKEQCQKGIPASLRAKCWPLLCGAADRMKHNIDIYKSLDSQPALQSWEDMIERDLDRQFPFHEMFLSKDGHGQRGLFRVLKAYTQYQPEEGYCQAQGPVAAVLLMNMPAEEAFWCLVQISEHYLPGYYSPLLEGVLFDAAMLTWVLKRTCPAIHRHLQHHGVEPLMYATDWLMCLFTRHLPFNTLLRVWDLFFCYGVRVLFQVAVVLVRTVLGRAEQRRECQGQMETLERLRGVREHVQQEDNSFIAEVCSVPLTKKDLKRQTEKELTKWRKDRPASTFDPRERCHGYRMVWARERATKEELDKMARERGNLSVPLIRSPSTLSLSPSLLRKKWRKGGKTDANEWEGGAKVQRNFSMVLSERRRDSWLDAGPKEVQPVEEEADEAVAEQTFETTVTEPKQTPTAPEEEPQNIPEERRELKGGEAIEQREQNVSENSQPTETEGGSDPASTPSQETQPLDKEDGSGEVERIRAPDECQSTREDGQHSEDTSHPEPSTDKQEEGLGCNSQSQAIAQQNQEKEVENRCRDVTQEVMSTHVAESENVVVVLQKQSNVNIDTNAGRETQAEVHRTEKSDKQTGSDSGEATELETPAQTHTEMTMGSETEAQTSPEKGLGSQMDRDDQAVAVKHPYPAQDTRAQQGPDAITQTEESAQRDTLREPDAGALADIETRAASLALAERERVDAVEAQERGEEDDTGLQEETEIGAQSETILVLREDASSLQETTEAQTLTLTKCADIETLTDDQIEPDKASAKSSEECEAVSPGPAETQVDTEEEEGEGSCNHTSTEDTPGETLTHPIKTDDPAPQGEPRSTTEPAELKPTAEPDRTESSEQFAAELTVSPVVEKPKTQNITPSQETQLRDKEDGRGEVEQIQAPGECQSTGEDGQHSEDASHPEPSTDKQEEGLGCNSQSQGEPRSTTEPAEPAELKPTAEPDGTESPEQFSSELTLSPVVEKPKIQNVNKTEEQQDVFTFPPSIPQLEEKEECCAMDSSSTANSTQLETNDDSHLPEVHVELRNTELIQAVGQRISSTDFCVRKSFSSHGSRLTRRLSEVLFTAPQLTIPSQSSPPPSQSKDNVPEPNPVVINAIQTSSDTTSSLSPQPSQDVALSISKEGISNDDVAVPLREKGTKDDQVPPCQPKRFGLFRLLRGEQPKQAKEKGAAKIQVPKILIQDFSDGVGKERTVEDAGEEKLSSREKRRRRRERERREKEEEKLRKKREQEIEKEKQKERRRPKTRDKSFNVQREQSDENPKCSAPYADSYF